MKYILTLFLAFFSMSTFAQSKDETAIAASVEKLRMAMISGERAALENIALDKLSYGHSGGKVENKDQFVESIASGKSDFVTIDLSDQTVSISNNVAIVRHNLSATTNDGGKPGAVKLHIMTIWEKVKGDWKMLARQAVKIN